jgi:endonuclease/exonuclease/phosphatase family metal-dependent hydrolase
MRTPSFRLIVVTGLLTVGLSCGGRPPAGADAGLVVMSYNIHYGQPDLGGAAEAICSSGADAVGLQEVDVRWGERSDFADQAAVLAAACGMEHRFGPIYTLPALDSGSPDRQFGVAVLSRLPILSSANHLLTRLSTQAEGRPGPAPGFLQVTVDVDGSAVDVFVTHLDFRPDPEVRATQVEEMLALLEASDRPTILLGDMNATPERTELAPLFSTLRDAWTAGEGEGFTFPAESPDRRIDYVFVRGPLAVLETRVLESDASDHRPVLSRLSLRAP